MQMPRFTADSSLYRTTRHYRAVAARAADFGGLAFPAIAKGTHCVADPECSTGFSKIFCRNFDPDSCVETGVCCTRQPPPPPPPGPVLRVNRLVPTAAFVAAALRARIAATTTTAVVQTVRPAEASSVSISAIRFSDRPDPSAIRYGARVFDIAQPSPPRASSSCALQHSSCLRFRSILTFLPSRPGRVHRRRQTSRISLEVST